MDFLFYISLFMLRCVPLDQIYSKFILSIHVEFVFNAFSAHLEMALSFFILHSIFIYHITVFCLYQIIPPSIDLNPIWSRYMIFLLDCFGCFGDTMLRIFATIIYQDYWVLVFDFIIFLKDLFFLKCLVQRPVLMSQQVRLPVAMLAFHIEWVLDALLLIQLSDVTLGIAHII